LSPNQLKTLAICTGVAANIVDAMTLSAYDGTALRLLVDSDGPQLTLATGGVSN